MAYLSLARGQNAVTTLFSDKLSINLRNVPSDESKATVPFLKKHRDSLPFDRHKLSNVPAENKVVSHG